MTAPYYVDDFVTLYHGDSLDVLPTLARSSAPSDPVDRHRRQRIQLRGDRAPIESASARARGDAMTAACFCPAMPDVTAPMIGAVRCACCGEPLELACPKACGKSAAPAPEKSAKSGSAKARVYAEKACALCHQAFTPTGSRSVVCERCKSANPGPKTPVTIAAHPGAQDAI